MDSLRYWVNDCHVDGFRFDLASALAREFHDVDKLATFFDVIHQDPVLSQVKLIAEPWDVGPGGYQVGNFPVLWAEWNDRYRDTMRDLWRGHGDVASFARRFTGSSDLYQDDGRHPSASINYVTAHDGFTLADLVSYDGKHNEANGEENRDGTDDNRSWNCGAEGPTDDPDVRALRERQKRNFLATLLLSHGVPMLLAGDEIGRTQHGNNNAWCQDNEISWLDWELDAEKEQLLAFTRRLVELRRRHPVFRRSRFLNGRSDRPTLPDSWWLRPDGRRMTQQDWETPGTHVVGLYLNGAEIGSRTPEGEAVVDDSFLLLLNATHEPVHFVLPPRRFGARWEVELRTDDPDAHRVVPPCPWPPRCRAALARSPARSMMRVLFATAELTPVAAAGGLAQAAAGLVRELRRQGVEVEVALPDYTASTLSGEEQIELDVPEWARPAVARRGIHAEFGPLTLVSVPGIERPHPYQDADGEGWPDNDARFFAFSAAVAALSQETTAGHRAPERLAHGRRGVVGSRRDPGRPLRAQPRVPGLGRRRVGRPARPARRRVRPRRSLQPARGSDRARRRGRGRQPDVPGGGAPPGDGRGPRQPAPRAWRRAGRDPERDRRGRLESGS